jgi:RNA polymerase sigma-70 factor (ECF subfamily)
MLAAQAAAGDGVAFEALVLRYQARIHRLALLLAGGCGYDADDLTQETLIRAYRAIDRFRGDSSFRTWLHRIALNVIWSHRARHRRGMAVTALDPRPGAMKAGVEAASDDDPEASFIRRDAIARALAELSEDARVVVILRDIQGLEYQEIATLTHVPIGTVESRLFRARRRLRPLLESFRDGGPRAAGLAVEAREPEC